jgi:hypothetical protein
MEQGKYHKLITSEQKGFRLNLKEVFKYKDLIYLLVKRDFGLDNSKRDTTNEEKIIQKLFYISYTCNQLISFLCGEINKKRFKYKSIYNFYYIVSKSYNDAIDGFIKIQNNMEKEKKELKDYKKKNIHNNKRLHKIDQSKVVERLYKDDIQKRKEKQQTLLKIYELSFQPNLHYTNKKNINTNSNNNNSNLSNTKSSLQFNKFKNHNNPNINSKSNFKTIAIQNNNNKNNNNHGYINTSYSKRKNEDSSEENSISEDNSNEEEIVITNRLRSKLFSNKKKNPDNVNNNTFHGNKKLKLKI